MLTMPDHLFDHATRVEAGDSRWQGRTSPDYWAQGCEFGDIQVLSDGDQLLLPPTIGHWLDDKINPTSVVPDEFPEMPVWLLDALVSGEPVMLKEASAPYEDNADDSNTDVDNDDDDDEQESPKTEPPKVAVPSLVMQLATKLWGQPTAGTLTPTTQFGNDDSTKKLLHTLRGDWYDFESNTYGGVRDLMKMVAAHAANPNASNGPTLQWHGDAAPLPPHWLIRERMPETGKGLLVGQWGAYKTFCALDISAQVMLGWDWTGEPVYRQCGVLFIAKEGSSSIPMRLAALVENIINPRKLEPNNKITDTSRLPFAWTSSCPVLLGVGKDDPLPVLKAMAAQAHQRFMEQYGLPLGMIWIDTVSSATGFEDEDDNAEAARLMGVLGALSDATGAVVIGVDHLGKNVDAGTRGGSAKEGNADFVLALLGTKDLAGNVSDTRMSVRKVREGPTGKEFPFAPIVVDMGHDQHNYPLTSVVLDWNVERAPPKESKTKNRSVQILDEALERALKIHGKMIKPANATQEIKAVARMHLLDSFKALYNPKGGGTDESKRVAFRRALKEAKHIGEETINGVSYLWTGVPF
jgi:hypothetical protein